jgi:hypothetical protein
VSVLRFELYLQSRVARVIFSDTLSELISW